MNPTPPAAFFLALRYLVCVWRMDTYDANGLNGKLFENLFLSRFDFAFRLRRTAHLLEWAQTNKPDFSPCLIRHLTRLTRMRDRLRMQDESKTPAGARISWTASAGRLFRRILVPVSDQGASRQSQNNLSALSETQGRCRGHRGPVALVFEKNARS